MTDITVEVVAAPAIEVTVTQAGAPGMSAYQLAFANDPGVGTLEEWLASLQGPAGPTAVSGDADNAAILGTDDLIYVPASGGGGTWGTITGTLTDQTDLAAALAGKASSAQGALADTAVQPAALTGYVPTTRTVNGNALTGDVVLDADDIADGTTNHVFTAVDDSKLAGIAESATANSADATLLARANHTGTQTASTISDFNTAADARVVAGITGKLDTSAAPELIRDTVGTALVAGTNVTITVNDAGDTITIDAAGGGGGSDPEVRHDSDATYSYMGSAANGTAEGSSGWTVTRITLTSPPVIETGSGTWSGRAGLSYS